ncbi:MAG: DUF3617 domain-containing protein [Steroidobacteraceae bacterium]
MLHRPRRRRAAPAVALFAIATAAALAAGAALNLRTGLWEITYTVATQGAPAMPAEVLARMTPEQRARLEAAQRARANQGPRTHTVKSCVTPQDIKGGAFRAQDDKDDPHCSYHITAQTATLQEGTMSCTGETPRTMAIRVEAADAGHMKGTMKGSAGKAQIDMRMEGRWIAASCAGADDE